MKYYFNKTLTGTFDQILERIKLSLQQEGFGVLTEIDLQKTFKKKLDLDFRKYKILGTCNPEYAYKALASEDKVGTMLPCNIIVQETGENTYEVAAVNPKASMQAIENEELLGLAEKVGVQLENIIHKL